MKKTVFMVTMTLVLIGGVYYLVMKHSVPETTPPYVMIDEHKITVEIADTPESRSQGLSGRAALAPGSGMLFVFETPAIENFWMKNMNFALDIIWIYSAPGTDSGEIMKIDANLPPEGETPEKIYSSDYPVNFVLEVPAGFVEKYGLQTGDKVMVSF